MPIRTAVLGYGLAGRVFHAPFIAGTPGLELTAIIQRSGDSAATAWPHAKILRSVDEALDDPALDLLVVATPDATHAEFAARALRAGKHVVVDKPLANTTHHVRELIAIAAAKKKTLFPYQNRRWDGDFLTVSKLLHEGTLGRVVEITSRFDRFRPLQKPDSWKEADGASGGLLFDLGSHLVDQALALFGLPDRLTASVRRYRDTTSIDDAFDITLEYDHAPLAGGPLRYTCASSFLNADPSPRFRVHGTRGSYTKYGVDPQEPTVLAGTLPPVIGSETPWLREPESAWGTLTLAPDPAKPTELTHEKLRTETGDYRNFYADVRDSITENRLPTITGEAALHTLTLLELARQSSHERRTLNVTL